MPAHWPWLAGILIWNRSVVNSINCISSTCAFPVNTSQNVCCEQGLYWSVMFTLLHQLLWWCKVFFLCCLVPPTRLSLISDTFRNFPHFPECLLTTRMNLLHVYTCMQTEEKQWWTDSFCSWQEKSFSLTYISRAVLELNVNVTMTTLTCWCFAGRIFTTFTTVSLAEHLLLTSIICQLVLNTKYSWSRWECQHYCYSSATFHISYCILLYFVLHYILSPYFNICTIYVLGSLFLILLVWFSFIHIFEHCWREPENKNFIANDCFTVIC